MQSGQTETAKFSTERDRQYATILDIHVDSTSMDKVLGFVKEKLAKRAKFYIVTPNPEIVLEAGQDRVLAEILNRADLSLPDGSGLIFASNFLGQPKLNLLPGRKVMLELLGLANERGLKVFFLGSSEGTIERSLKKVSSKFPRLTAEGFSGPILAKNGIPASGAEGKREKMTIDKINKFSPDFLFVAFGAPKQEKWIARWLTKLNIGGAMVVGGALDYYSGVSQLPPAWMEDLGLEWLWRLVKEPYRIKRILKATILFPFRVFCEIFHA